MPDEKSFSPDLTLSTTEELFNELMKRSSHLFIAMRPTCQEPGAAWIAVTYWDNSPQGYQQLLGLIEQARFRSMFKAEVQDREEEKRREEEDENGG